MNNDLWGYVNPIETNSTSRTFNGSSNVVYGGYPPGDVFNGFPGGSPGKTVDADEITRDYETRRIHVDKRTHRIRFENESENEVMVVVEPK